MVKDKLAIFDLDGTLFDTYPANWLSYKTALEEYGFKLPEQYFRERCQGRYYREFLPPLLNGADEAVLQAVHQRKQTLYRTFLDRVRKNEHLFRFLETIRFEYATAIVTTASRKNCAELLEYFNKTAYFDIVITREDVTKSKPDPEGFIKAMTHFGKTPEQTVIFEDSPEGVTAATATGASIFSVTQF
ncbi:hydrolase [Planctomycetales bacterium]|nr:hydrolase [Planctomycetales bacterium]